MLLALCFILPVVVFYLLVIKSMDRFEPEPVWLLGVMFLWGALGSTLAALILNQVGQAAVGIAVGAESAKSEVDMLTAVLVAPPVEESTKGFGLLLLWGLSAVWLKELDGPLDGAIYGGVVGLGFTLTEDVLYVTSAFGQAGAAGFMAVFVLRSGLFAIVPVVDKVSNYVDQRIRVTGFSAELTLTRDTVPVNVDAIAFWMVWDAEKSILEVEDFVNAVTLSAQTGLRDAIGKHELADMLSHRDRLGKEIQQVLDAKTNAWGITVQSVEIRDIIIPKALEDAMSRQAQAERERQARIILSTAETEIAAKFEEASRHYRHNPCGAPPARHEHGLRGPEAEGLDDHRPLDRRRDDGPRRHGRPHRLRPHLREADGSSRTDENPEPEDTAQPRPDEGSPWPARPEGGRSQRLERRRSNRAWSLP